MKAAQTQLSLSPHPISLTERRRWTQRYEHLLRDQLVRALTHVHRSRPPELLPHLDSLLMLLHRARRWRALHPLAVDLIIALHPWPLRWLRWESWEREIRFAIQACAVQNRPDQEAEFLGHLAHVLFNSGYLDEALDAAQEALRLAKAHGAVAPLAIAGCVLVPILLQQGRASEARHSLNELLSDVSRAEAVASREKTEALARLRLQQLTFLRRDNRLDDAVTQASRTLTQLKDLSGVNEHLVAETYRERSTMAWAAGQYPEAVRDIKRAIQMFAEQGDEFAEISAWGNLGLIYYSMTEFDLAEEGIRRVIALAERLNARHQLIYAVDYLGAIYLMRGELNRATSYFDRAVDLARNSGAFKDLYRIRSNRAVVRLYKGDYLEAIPDLKADLRFSEGQQLSGAVLMDCICLSLCYLELGQGDRALRLAERAMEIANTQENAIFQTLALRCLAEHRRERRGHLLRRALDLARQNQRPLDEAGCLLSLVGLTGCRDERAKLWRRGVQILEEIGANGWLADASVDAPPRVIILM